MTNKKVMVLINTELQFPNFLCKLLIYDTTVWDWIHEFRCYEVKIEGSEKAAARGWTQDTSGLSRQWSATEPRQPDDH